MGKGDFSADAASAARDIAEPADPIVAAIFGYWEGKRGGRRMPSRADIDPAELRRLLPNVMLYEVVAPGRLYTIRLVGGAIVDFYGVNSTGQMAGSRMPPDAAAQMIEILTSVVLRRAPRFRAGLAHWHRDKSYRSFEACFLPLSPDDDCVDKILAGVAFDTYGDASRSGP
jgi:hypothetical protein